MEHCGLACHCEGFFAKHDCSSSAVDLLEHFLLVLGKWMFQEVLELGCALRRHTAVEEIELLGKSSWFWNLCQHAEQRRHSWTKWVFRIRTCCLPQCVDIVEVLGTYPLQQNA